MHIARIHSMLEILTEAAFMELSEKKICEVNTKELGDVIDMIKDLAEAEYHSITVREISSDKIETDADISDFEAKRRKYHEDKTQDSLDGYTKGIVAEITDIWGTLDNVSRTMVKTRLQSLLAKMG